MKKRMVRVPDFYQKIMQWKAFCIHFVKFLYEGSEPIGSQWGGVPSVKEDFGLWYFTVCNCLLCVILIYHFISSIFPVSCFGMQVAHWFFGMYLSYLIPMIELVKRFKYGSCMIFCSTIHQNCISAILVALGGFF